MEPVAIVYCEKCVAKAVGTCDELIAAGWWLTSGLEITVCRSCADDFVRSVNLYGGMTWFGDGKKYPIERADEPIMVTQCSGRSCT